LLSRQALVISSGKVAHFDTKKLRSARIFLLSDRGDNKAIARQLQKMTGLRKNNLVQRVQLPEGLLWTCTQEGLRRLEENGGD